MDIDELLSMTPADLEHHGVKGMKWGVRNDKGHEGQKATTKKIAKLDKKFEKNAKKKYFDVANATSKEMNEKIIPTINSKPKYKNANFNDPKNAKLFEKYNNEFANEVTYAINRHSESMIGKNASGTKKVMFAWDPTKQVFPSYGIFDADTKVEAMYHAETPNILLDVTFDSNKHVTKVVIPESIFESVIEHHGVKGMKWGVSKVRKAGSVINHPIRSGAAKKVATKAKSAVSPKRLKKAQKKINSLIEIGAEVYESNRAVDAAIHSVLNKKL